MRATYASTSGAASAGSRWKGSPRAMVSMAAFVYMAMSVTLVFVWGSELDRDAVFPGGESSSGEVTFSSGSSATNPPDSVLFALAALGGVVAVPILFRRRLFLVVLAVSTFLVGISLVMTVLRLGIFLTPVLVLLVLALVRTLSGAGFSNSRSGLAK